MDDTSNIQKLFQLKQWNRGISDEEILADIKRIAQFLGKNTLTYEEYEKLGRVSCVTVLKRFGSWNNALSKAGLQVQRYVNIPKEKLFENMEQVWISLGKQPTQEEMKKSLSSYSKGTYERRFGTWRKALEEFVNWINGETKDRCPSVVLSIDKPKKTSRQPNQRLKFQVMLRDNFKCRYCGKSPATHLGIVLNIDHIIPWSEGGETTIENLQTLCEDCNSGKSNLSSTSGA